MARLAGHAVHWVRKEHRRQKIRLLVPLFAELLALELLDLAGHGGFPVNDSIDEKGRLNESLMRLRLLAIHQECHSTFLEPAQTHFLVMGCPQP